MSDRNFHPSLKTIWHASVIVEQQILSLKEMWQTKYSLLTPHAKNLNKRQEIYWMPYEEVMLRRPSSVWKSWFSAFLLRITRKLRTDSCGKFSNSKIKSKNSSARADAWRDKPSFVKNSAEHLNKMKRCVAVITLRWSGFEQCRALAYFE